MAETETIEAQTEQQAQDDFASGFTEALPAAKTEPEVKPEETPAPEAKVDPEPEPVPEYVQITKEQFDTLQAAAGKTVAMEGQFSKVFGTVGDLQQIVKKLQAGTPAGQPIELPKGAFARTRKDFPELAELIEGDLAEALKGMRGTAPAPAQEVDPKVIHDQVSAASVKVQIEALEDAHPTWRTIVGTVDGEGRHNPDNPFRKWLATQDQAYQARINASNSATILSRAIDKFQASQTVKPATPKPVPTPKIAARVDRIRGAIQPKGDGGQPAPSKTDHDEFRAGFESG